MRESSALVRKATIYTAEAELLLNVARTATDTQVIDRLLPSIRDWPWFHRQVLKHGLSALAHRHLAGHGAALPEAMQDQLATRSRQVAFHNMKQTRELLRVTDALESDGIPVIPFKGPALALWGYGDVSLRRFGDLDMLVPYERVGDARQCLESALGYASHKTFANGEAQAFVDTGMGWEFVHEKLGSVVELHWSFFFKIYPFALQPADVWARHTPRPVGGREVRSFDTIDMLLYLCYHGLKHRFASLKWSVDVREWVRAHPSLDWDLAFARAEDIQCLRAVHVALLLAHDLLDLSLDREVLRRARADRQAQHLVEEIVEGWLFAELEETATETIEDILFHVRSCDKLRHGWPFVWHYLKLGGESMLQRFTGETSGKA